MVAGLGRSHIWWKMLMAIPQCAMAQVGSRLRIRSNCGCDSSYQKSCSRATPRLKLAWVEGAQETENEMVPRRSFGWVADWRVGRIDEGCDEVAWPATGSAASISRNGSRVFMAAAIIGPEYEIWPVFGLGARVL